VGVDFRRWGVFNLVGCAGFAAQIAAIALLTRVCGWSPFAATIVGLELAALQNFVGHSRWTWGDAPPAGLREWLKRYLRYQAAKTASLAVNLLLTTGLIHCQLPPEIANTAAVLLCALPNYLISERYVFGYTSRNVEQT
jgi:putative flippase GtrA